jgi:hypothetical protein
LKLYSVFGRHGAVISCLVVVVVVERSEKGGSEGGNDKKGLGEM